MKNKLKVLSNNIEKARDTIKDTTTLPKVNRVNRHSSVAQNTRSRMNQKKDEDKNININNLIQQKSENEIENILEDISIPSKSESELNINDGDDVDADEETFEDMFSIDSEMQKELDEERIHGKYILTLEALRVMDALLPEQFNHLKQHYILKAAIMSNYFDVKVDDIKK